MKKMNQFINQNLKTRKIMVFQKVPNQQKQKKERARPGANLLQNQSVNLNLKAAKMVLIQKLPNQQKSKNKEEDLGADKTYNEEDEPVKLED